VKINIIVEIKNNSKKVSMLIEKRARKWLKDNNPKSK